MGQTRQAWVLATAVACMARAGDRRRTRGPDEALAVAGGSCGGNGPTPLVRRCAPKVGRVVFYWPGCVPRVGTPWKASHGRGGLAGGRSSGTALALPLAAAVFRPGKATQGNLRSFLRQARPHSARCCAALTPARSDWLRSVRTENTNCNDQPRIGQGAPAHV